MIEQTNIDKAIVEGINFNLNAANEKINEIISLKLAKVAQE